MRVLVKSQEERAKEYALLSNEDLMEEFGTEVWAQDRCVGDSEHLDSRNCLAALRAELLKRMVVGANRA